MRLQFSKIAGFCLWSPDGITSNQFLLFCYAFAFGLPMRFGLPTFCLWSPDFAFGLPMLSLLTNLLLSIQEHMMIPHRSEKNCVVLKISFRIQRSS